MKEAILIPAILATVSSSYGQSTMRPNIYFGDMNYYNIAAIPLKDTQSINFSFYTKYKFVENESYVWNKPPVFFLNHVGSLKNKHSFYNVAIISDQYSFYSRNTIYAGYTYRLKLGQDENHTIDMGGRLVFNFDLINWSKLQLPSNESGKSVKPTADMDWGAFYRFKNFSFGFSTKNMIGTSVKLYGEKILINQREFYVNTSYLFQIKDKFEIEPFLLYRKELTSELDIGLRLGFFKRMNAAYQLRLIQLRHIFTLQGHISKSLSIGLAFDYSKLINDNNLDAVIRYTF